MILWIILLIAFMLLYRSGILYKINVRNVTKYRPIVEREILANPPVNAELILGMIAVESDGKEGAIGSNKEIGLMQITPIALEDINSFLLPVEGVTITSDQLLESMWNIKAGIVYLWLRYRQHNNMSKAIRSYNAGDRAVTENRDSLTYLQKVRSAERQVKDFYA